MSSAAPGLTWRSSAWSCGRELGFLESNIQRTGTPLGQPSRMGVATVDRWNAGRFGLVGLVMKRNEQYRGERDLQAGCILLAAAWYLFLCL